ncbi:MAG: peptidylprolyl isomerase [Candidatus Krumholzibacteriota bacterium]|nr:peptidylprolyl isomerase [Candidatus Krumholzibacteriota bacterium]
MTGQPKKTGEGGKILNGKSGILAAAAGALLLLGLTYNPGAAGYDEKNVIDRVIAIVEDEAVLHSDLEAGYARFLFQRQNPTLSRDEEAEIKTQIRDQLVADLLMKIHAEKVGIEISEDNLDADVERQIEERMRAAGSEETFRNELDRSGMTLQQLRSMWREQLKAQRLILGIFRQEVSSDIKVTDGEMREYFQQHLEQFPLRPATVTLAQIMVPLEISDQARAEALKKIAEVERRLRGGEDFAAVAKELSEGPSAKYGGSLGYMKLEDFGTLAFEEAVRNMSVGEISGPVLTEHGYHIIKLEEIDRDQVRLRHILIKVERDLESSLAAAEGIREELLKGADFGEMAGRYSADEKTKSEGGMVGEIPVENLPEFFVAVIKDLSEGEISPVIKDPKGFRIVKLLAKSPARKYTYREAKDQISDVLEQQKMESKYMEYVEGLKRIYHVEIKEAR